MHVQHSLSPLHSRQQCGLVHRAVAGDSKHAGSSPELIAGTGVSHGISAFSEANDVKDETATVSPGENPDCSVLIVRGTERLVLVAVGADEVDRIARHVLRVRPESYS